MAFNFRYTKRRRVFLFFLTIVTLTSGYVYFSLPSYNRYLSPAAKNKCEQKPEDLAGLLNLTYRVHSVLNSFSLDHWLMYGSLFGAIRNQGPLPWDYDVDLAVKGEQFSKVKFEDFVAACEEHGLTVMDKRLKSGMLAFFDSKLPLYVDLFIYYEYKFGMMWRSGLEAWLFFLHYRMHHAFPVRLVDAPLPKTKFGFFEIAIPRGNEEVLKYLYRYDWWKEVRPAGC